MTSKVKNDFCEAHFNIVSCFFMISIRMVKENVKIFKKFHFARIRAQNEISFEKKRKMDDQKNMVRYLKKEMWRFLRKFILRASARKMNFRLKKKNQYMARPYGRGHCLRLRRETFSGKLTLKNDMFLFYFRETAKKIIVRAGNKNL